MNFGISVIRENRKSTTRQLESTVLINVTKAGEWYAIPGGGHLEDKRDAWYVVSFQLPLPVSCVNPYGNNGQTLALRFGVSFRSDTFGKRRKQ